MTLSLGTAFICGSVKRESMLQCGGATHSQSPGRSFSETPAHMFPDTLQGCAHPPKPLTACMDKYTGKHQYPFLCVSVIALYLCCQFLECPCQRWPELSKPVLCSSQLPCRIGVFIPILPMKKGSSSWWSNLPRACVGSSSNGVWMDFLLLGHATSIPDAFIPFPVLHLFFFLPPTPTHFSTIISLWGTCSLCLQWFLTLSFVIYVFLMTLGWEHVYQLLCSREGRGLVSSQRSCGKSPCCVLSIRQGQVTRREALAELPSVDAHLTLGGSPFWYGCALDGSELSTLSKLQSGEGIMDSLPMTETHSIVNFVNSFVFV